VRSTPTAWAIRQVRAHEPLFNACDRVLKKGAAVRGSLVSGPSGPASASLAPPAADREPADGAMTSR
jgi:hypothetical protein